jgi:hypothetical protein
MIRYSIEQQPILEGLVGPAPLGMKEDAQSGNSGEVASFGRSLGGCDSEKHA